MEFIELKELYYHHGGYITKPLMCNVEEISNITEERYGYGNHCTEIVMKNGNRYLVKDEYSDVINKIVKNKIEKSFNDEGD